MLRVQIRLERLLAARTMAAIGLQVIDPDAVSSDLDSCIDTTQHIIPETGLIRTRLGAPVLVAIFVRMPVVLPIPVHTPPASGGFVFRDDGLRHHRAILQIGEDLYTMAMVVLDHACGGGDLLRFRLEAETLYRNASSPN